MRLALTDLFKAHWTDQIHDEWINAVVRQGKHKLESLHKARDLMDVHAKDAKVFGYEGIIDNLLLPDDFLYYQLDMAPTFH